MSFTLPIPRKAYSTFEVLIVLSIIGITTAIAAPRYFSSIRRSKLDRAVSLIAADLAKARDNARAYGMDQTVTFNNERYRVTTRTATGEKLENVDLRIEPYEGAVSMLRTGSNNTVTFNKHGMPSNTMVMGIRTGNILRVLSLSTEGDLQILEGTSARTKANSDISDPALTASLAVDLGPG
jgi:Tfp pilus assembly protein FimT